MTNRNTHPTGILGVRQSSIAEAPQVKDICWQNQVDTYVVVIISHAGFWLPVSAQLADMNADEDGTIIYRKISGVFHEVGFVGRNVTSFTDDPPGAGDDTFCWIVRAFREGDISGSSNETCASVPTTSSSTTFKARTARRPKKMTLPVYSLTRVK
jgi:hypothetical protein